MCGLTKASTSVVTARSYSRYSGSTSHESEIVHSGYSSGEDLGDAALMARIGVGMDEADADRIDAVARERRRRPARTLRFVQRPQLLAHGNSRRPPTSRTNRNGTMRSGFTQKYELP